MIILFKLPITFLLLLSFYTILVQVVLLEYNKNKSRTTLKLIQQKISLLISIKINYNSINFFKLNLLIIKEFKKVRKQKKDEK